jgi:hypothetical protein
MQAGKQAPIMGAAKWHNNNDISAKVVKITALCQPRPSHRPDFKNIPVLLVLEPLCSG